MGEGGTHGVSERAGPDGVWGGSWEGGGAKTEGLNGGVKAFGQRCNAIKEIGQRIHNPLAFAREPRKEGA